MPFKKRLDPDMVRYPVTIRIKRSKLNEINRYCSENNISRSEFLADIIHDHDIDEPEPAE